MSGALPRAVRQPSVRRKAARLEVRVKPETKQLCEQAAALKGLTLSDFVMHSTLEAARQAIRESETIQLTYEDRLAFFNALLNPPPPSERLRKAVKEYEETFGKQ